MNAEQKRENEYKKEQEFVEKYFSQNNPSPRHARMQRLWGYVKFNSTRHNGFGNESAVYHTLGHIAREEFKLEQGKENYFKQKFVKELEEQMKERGV